MRIQLRIRVNDLNEDKRADQLINDGFILFDNCSEVKFGSARIAGLTEFAIATGQYKILKNNETYSFASIPTKTKYSFDGTVIVMARDIDATEERLATDPKFKGRTRVDYKLVKGSDENLYETPYHYNVIEWKDRISGKEYRLVYDTVAFLTDDDGKTIRKIDG